ncbi:MAG: hypothetical protein IJ160_13445 [Muribaculaceae bacterium]|nr:hypothetical protein [Muribaculaceae bacterium]
MMRQTWTIDDEGVLTIRQGFCKRRGQPDFYARREEIKAIVVAEDVLEAVGGEVHVELQPVELPLERLSVALFATLAVAFELQEIDFSGYDHD